MGNKRAERRRFIRFGFNTKVKFRFFSQTREDEHFKGKSKNISADGVCVVAENDIPRDKNVALDISLPGRKRPVSVHGRVAWSQKIKNADKRAPDHYEIGIKLYTTDRDDENTLLRYYCEYMVDNLSQYLHI